MELLDGAGQPVPRLRVEPSHPFADPRHLLRAGGGHGHQQQAEHPLGPGQGVVQGQGAAPGGAGDQPALHPEVLAQQFQVLQQVGGGVVLEPVPGITHQGCAAAGAALLQRDQPVALGVEVAPVARTQRCAGSAMEVEGRNAVGVAALLPVQLVALACREHAGASGG